MAGIEGYFGPTLTDDDYEDLGIKRQPKRPNNIELRKIHTTSNYPITPREEDDVAHKYYVEVGVSLATLFAENLLSHPFVVLRRQCQANKHSSKYHLVPITLIPVIVHLHQSQGITTLWKGIGSVMLVRGMTLAIEDLISKISSWPKEVHWGKDSIPVLSQHILLKCVTLFIITPFYSASLVETVQSEIASEKPGIFDVFREGACRLFCFASPKGRMLPVLTLVIPTVMYGIFKYFISSIVKNVSSNIMHLNHRHQHQKRGAYPKDWLNSSLIQEIEVTSQLISLVAADVIFYPLETILHRLHLQGTRTIIDNLDNGFSVSSVVTSYEGTLDCYDTILSEEGSVGLFKGFGALLLQFTAHYAVLKLTKFILTQVTVLLKSSNLPPSRNVMPSHNIISTPVIHNQEIKTLKTPIRYLCLELLTHLLNVKREIPGYDYY